MKLERLFFILKQFIIIVRKYPKGQMKGIFTKMYVFFLYISEIKFFA